MEKDEVEDRKRLLARLEKEREILQILEEVRRQSGDICTDTCHYLAASQNIAFQEDTPTCIYLSILMSVFLFMYPL